MEITLPSWRKIGERHPCFIVAEVGSNWSSLDDCIESIRKAKECGADAVKYQLFDQASLYGVPNIYDGSYQMPYSLPRVWIPALKEYADKIGIEFMCSAFSPELIEVVDKFANIHKVASAEMCHVRMLERLREIGKPVFLSTGAHRIEEITKALWVLEGIPVIPLYCVAAYPARHVETVSMGLLKHELKLPVGFSDHTTDIGVIPLAFVKAGACVIEKHVNFVGARGPDAAHSLNTEEFKAMVDSIRYGGIGRIGPMPSEKPMLDRHNRRLIATKDIAAGQKLSLEDNFANFGIYRSLKDAPNALSPFMVDEVNGLTAKRDIKAGNGITKEDI